MLDVQSVRNLSGFYRTLRQDAHGVSYPDILCLLMTLTQTRVSQGSSKGDAQRTSGLLVKKSDILDAKTISPKHVPLSQGLVVIIKLS